MASAEFVPSTNKYSRDVILDKTSKVLAAIDKCSCDHCLELLKKGLEEPTSPNPDVDDATNPGRTGYDYNK